jgi:peptidoglycan LD-endopeptidase CwlK
MTGGSRRASEFGKCALLGRSPPVCTVHVADRSSWVKRAILGQRPATACIHPTLRWGVPARAAAGHTAGPTPLLIPEQMIAAVALYFALATAALALWLLPAARAQAIGWAHRVLYSGAAARRSIASDGQRRVQRMVQVVGTQSAQTAGWVAQHRRLLLAGGAVLTLAPVLPLALRGFLELDGYDHRLSREVNEQVAALLRGEQLVPPPPVPPEWFTTREVEQARPLIRGASRQWELLDAQFRQRMLVVFKLMREQHGYEMVLLEGYRSPERQAQLAAFGPQVTRAGAFESYHQYGLAADCAFLRDGRIVISEQDPWAAKGYALYGEVARSVGFTWGGGWRSIKDFGHVEMRRDGVLQRRSDSEQPTVPNVH